ncbi:MAG TPA: ankyrin repeat domain-containing protein [Thermoanaerobaculia bacterium]|jgi:ankyrin repeat protein
MQVFRTVCAMVVLALAVSSIHAAPKKFNAQATEKLLAAAAEGEADDMLAALKAGADPNARDEKKNTPLILASWSNLWNKDKAVVDALLKAKADVNATNHIDLTALMAAAGGGQNDMVNVLLASGAKLNAKDKDGWTALMYAAVNGEWRTTEALLAKKPELDNVDTDGYSALFIALNQGKGSVAERLIDAGADLTKKTPTGNTALVTAAYGRDLQCLRLVLEKSKPDLNATDSDGWTPLTIASYNGDSQIVMDLLRHGADPALKDKEGKTAVQRAQENESTEVVSLLTGKWDRPKAAGSKISMPCKALGGNVDAYVDVDGDALVITTLYPKPINWYLGGGLVNRADTATKYTYEGFVAPTYTIGAYTLDYMEYGTSVPIYYLDSEKNQKQKNVYGLSMSVDLKKGEEDVDTSSLESEQTPDASMEAGILTTRVPLSLLDGIKAGGKVKVTGRIGNCAPVTSQVALK